MPLVPVLQPNGQLAVYSTITDRYNEFGRTAVEAAESIRSFNPKLDAQVLLMDCQLVQLGQKDYTLWEAGCMMAFFHHADDAEYIALLQKMTPELLWRYIIDTVEKDKAADAQSA